MLKADLHLHTSEDRSDNITHSARELIAVAAKFGFKVLSITNHDLLTYDKALVEFAGKRGILLIPGIEKTIEGKHILLYNIPLEEAAKVRHLEDLDRLKGKDRLIVAAHPFFILKSCIGGKLRQYIHSFDAIEYSHFYMRMLNMNTEAVSLARRFNKPLLGTSDCHDLWQLNHTYSMIDSKPSISAVIAAIKAGRIKLASRPLAAKTFISGAAKMLKHDLTKALK